MHLTWFSFGWQNILERALNGGWPRCQLGKLIILRVLGSSLVKSESGIMHWESPHMATHGPHLGTCRRHGFPDPSLGLPSRVCRTGPRDLFRDTPHVIWGHSLTCRTYRLASCGRFLQTTDFKGPMSLLQAHKAMAVTFRRCATNDS